MSEELKERVKKCPVRRRINIIARLCHGAEAGATVVGRVAGAANAKWPRERRVVVDAVEHGVRDFDVHGAAELSNERRVRIIRKKVRNAPGFRRQEGRVAGRRRRRLEVDEQSHREEWRRRRCPCRVTKKKKQRACRLEAVVVVSWCVSVVVVVVVASGVCGGVSRRR